MHPISKLQVRQVSKRFDGDRGSVQVLDGISLDALSGEFVSIIGPSGCGKSTLFNILTGLLEPAASRWMDSLLPICGGAWATCCSVIC